MASELSSQSERLVKFSNRSRWLALALLLAMGTYALIINAFPDSAAAAMGGRMAVLLPVVIAIALGLLRSSLKGASADPRSAPMKAVLNDELRQRSLNLAYRNAVLAVLLAQPLLAAFLAFSAAQQPVLLMASATALTGVLAVLGSLLVYDR